MRRSNALIQLSREHHSGLLLAQLIKKGAPDYKNMPQDAASKLKYTISVFSDELLTHFKCEEEILIPFITGKDKVIDNLNLEILDEHNKVYALIESLKHNEDVEINLDALGMLLDAHIRKEERIWFEKIQALLSKDELKDLGNRIEKYK